MTTTSTIPCKRPKVTVTPRTPGGSEVDADCHVPGCTWTYPADKQFMALKSDADWQATHHRKAHRNAVPTTTITPTGHGAEVEAECSCGENWLSPTRAHAKTWLRHHLELDHKVVTCP